MEQTKRNVTKITMAILGTILVTVALATPLAALGQNVHPYTGEDYGDLDQYSWMAAQTGYFGSQGGDGIASQHNTPGPAPNKPTIAWSLQMAGYGLEHADWEDELFGPTPMNKTGEIGHVIRALSGFGDATPDICVGGNVLIGSVKGTIVGWTGSFFGVQIPQWAEGETYWLNALDAQTGTVKWSIQKPDGCDGDDEARPIDPEGTMFRLDYGSGWVVFDSLTGQELFTVDPHPTGDFMFELGQIAYDQEYSENNSIRWLRAWDHSAVLTRDGPTVRAASNEDSDEIWRITFSESASDLCADTDNGIVLFGSSYNPTVWAFNLTNGDLMWEAYTPSVTRNAVYYEGKFLVHGLQRGVYCYDTITGELLWKSEKGNRAYYGNSGCVGDGMFFAHVIDTPTGWTGCWDVDTGELLWRVPAYYTIGYFSHRYGDGKLYGILMDARGAGGEEIEDYNPYPDLSNERFELSACIDAATGEIIWTMPFQLGHNRGCSAGSFRSDVFMAYGNMYVERFCVLYCISDQASAAWTHYRGTPTQNAVSTERGPTDLSEPRWAFETGATVSATPAISADGKVYIGSYDKNIYCLDAYTGEKLWNFETGKPVKASVAVSTGKVYTGSDDGNIYCLNGDTGEMIWSQQTGTWGGSLDWSIHSETVQPRSSPLVIGGSVYVGSVDGKLYCLDAATGDVRWSYQTYGPILGSPMYYNGVVYIASLDTNGPAPGDDGRLYAFDAGNGARKWVTPRINGDDMICTPIMAEDVPGVGNVILIGSGGTTWIRGINVTDGSDATWSDGSTMNIRPQNTGDRQTYPLAYWNGLLFGYGGIYATAWNMSGNYADSRDRVIWTQWIVHNPAGAPLVSSSFSGTWVYFSSDGGGISCMDARTGEVKGTYTGLGIAGTPAIWEGKLYIGHGNNYVYCFDSAPEVTTQIYADPDKGAEMWVDETLTVSGRVYTERPYYVPEIEAAGTPAEDHMYYPGLQNATVQVIFVKPDMTDVTVTAYGDKAGFFSVEFTPDVVGDWSWTAYYPGKSFAYDSLRYTEAYSEYVSHSVVDPSAPTPTNGATPTPTPTPTDAFPVEYIYAIVAVIVIVIVGLVLYLFVFRRR
jgi:outer membrane protein assembly factor BamB